MIIRPPGEILGWGDLRRLLIFSLGGTGGRNLGRSPSQRRAGSIYAGHPGSKAASGTLPRLASASHMALPKISPPYLACY